MILLHSLIRINSRNTQRTSRLQIVLSVLYILPQNNSTEIYFFFINPFFLFLSKYFDFVVEISDILFFSLVW